MSHSGSMSRRFFLRVAALLMLASVVVRRDGAVRRLVDRIGMTPGAARGTGSDPASATGLAAAGSWRAVIPAPRSARVIGERYLAVAPEERDATLLMRRLQDVVDAGDGSRDGRAEGVRTQIHRDFAADDVVQVDGWVLARTECRLCALAVLLG